ncbi:hypothetical protein EON77_02500 [bacterium]|nr:MAG: hypothetical protein EON77_02500 [bacterium]
MGPTRADRPRGVAGSRDAAARQCSSARAAAESGAPRPRRGPRARRARRLPRRRPALRLPQAGWARARRRRGSRASSPDVRR